MKKVLNLFLVSAMMFASIPANSQDLKFGHINSQELLTAMPESDSAQASIEKLAGDYEQQLEEIVVVHVGGHGAWSTLATQPTFTNLLFCTLTPLYSA
mgnify:CR=1 FL=1